MKETSIIRVSTTTHSRIKEYCDRNGLKMGAWTEKIISKELDLRTLKR